MDPVLGLKSVVEWAKRGPDEADVEFAPTKDKFVVEMRIGSGGMGEVFVVTDQDLRRQVAMKVLRRDAALDREQRQHFIAEAQATSQLEHPGIPPVHEIGLTPDGRLYFTLKRVQGRTLSEILHDLALKRKEVAREYTLHRLVSILERICEAMHFSHEKGVIHRDLKPENIMLGDYGEVHVIDWGLARVSQTGVSDSQMVKTVRSEAHDDSLEGDVKGTWPYMSPEQMRGERDLVDRRTDVYTLGCLLYEFLTLHRAFDLGDPEMESKKLAGQLVDVATRNPRRRVPDALADICRKAMATKRDDRYDSAQGLRDALRVWLDGSATRQRRHAEAEKLTGQGEHAVAKYERLKSAVGEAADAAGAEEAKYKSWQPVVEKWSAIEARTKVETLKTEVALAFAEATGLFDAALKQESNNARARAASVDLWRARLEDAERRRDRAETAYALTVMERYSDEPLQTDGSLTLTTDPPGAEVFLHRYNEIADGVLSPGKGKLLGRTPLEPLPLPMGSYLCVVKKEGFRDTRYPVHITRERQWTDDVKLRTDDEIGESFVYVPKGPFIYGAGEDAQVKEIPDFAIARYPVTFGEYAEFLGSLDEDEAKERCPRVPEHGAFMETGDDGRWRPNSNLLDDETRELYLDRHGEGFGLRLPVLGVSWDDAVAYCVWKTETSESEWRLPTEEEREKAARGVDGRRFAWGDLEDASLGKCRESRPERPQPEPVGAFPTAESVYGMGDAAGGVWDWTDSWLDERRSSRVMRGGSWHTATSSLRSAIREPAGPSLRSTHLGFRCARDLSLRLEPLSS